LIDGTSIQPRGRPHWLTFWVVDPIGRRPAPPHGSEKSVRRFQRNCGAQATNLHYWAARHGGPCALGPVQKRW